MTCLLIQEMAKQSLPHQKARGGFSRVVGAPISAALLGRRASDSLHNPMYLGPSCTPMDGLTLPHQASNGESMEWYRS